MKNFEEFWPFYLSQHRHPVCRRLHFIGSLAALALVLISLFTSSHFIILMAPVIGYGFAWIGHFFFEKNRPATFRYPFWSFLGDVKMFYLTLTNRLEAELGRPDCEK